MSSSIRSQYLGGGLDGADGVAGIDSPLTLFASATANNDSVIEFTGFTTGHKKVIIDWSNIIPTTDDTQLQLQVSVDGGSTYITGNNYSIAARGRYGGNLGAVNFSSSGASNHIRLCGFNTNARLGTGVNQQACGFVELYNPSDANYTMANGLTVGISAIGSGYFVNFAGASETGVAVDAIQIKTSAGNISTGDFRVYVSTI